MERSEHNLFVRTYPHTNWIFSLSYIAIGVGVKFADGFAYDPALICWVYGGFKLVLGRLLIKDAKRKPFPIRIIFRDKSTD